jgi:hypothetical protein
VAAVTADPDAIHRARAVIFFVISYSPWLRAVPPAEQFCCA